MYEYMKSTYKIYTTFIFNVANDCRWERVPRAHFGFNSKLSFAFNYRLISQFNL